MIEEFLHRIAALSFGFQRLKEEMWKLRVPLLLFERVALRTDGALGLAGTDTVTLCPAVGSKAPTSSNQHRLSMGCRHFLTLGGCPTGWDQAEAGRSLAELHLSISMGLLASMNSCHQTIMQHLYTADSGRQGVAGEPDTSSQEAAPQSLSPEDGATDTAPNAAAQGDAKAHDRLMGRLPPNLAKSRPTAVPERGSIQCPVELFHPSRWATVPDFHFTLTYGGPQGPHKIWRDSLSLDQS